MNVTVPVYQRRRGAFFHWTTVGLGEHTERRVGVNAHKVEQQLVEAIRTKVERVSPRELVAFALKRGTRLARVRIELTLRGEGGRRKVSGLCPIVLEPHFIGEGRELVIGYHPERPFEWFPVRGDDDLAEQATSYLQKVWSAVSEDLVELLFTDGKDTLKLVSFSARPKSLLDELPEKQKGVWDDLRADPLRGEKQKSHGFKVLPTLATDLTARLAGDGSARAAIGMPRSPYREQLQMLLAGKQKQPVIVVGAHGVGKSTVLAQWVADLLVAEDFDSHKNLDKVHHVVQLGGKRIIAGMSYVGDWEKRCVELADDLTGKKRIAWIDDLHLFGQIGRARDSDRCLADFFRGPLARGEIVLVGECTEEQLRRLEEDAPAFAALFTRVFVGPTTPAETMRILVHEARELEIARDVEIEPSAFRTILELGPALTPGQALPGLALDLLRALAREFEGKPDESNEIGVDQVIAHLSSRTGLPWILLANEKPLLRDELLGDLSGRVLGQDVAVNAAADLVMRIKAGLVDPKRPYGVYLFTGPTGTGKTELAKTLAEYLYGGASRLVRFDMSEYGTPDAAGRLIGDAWTPEGALTRAAQEQPFCVVLLDEIEKAHPSVLNLLLQLFDEGRLTDARGETASFTQAVIVMTSNLGAKPQNPLGFGAGFDAVMQDVARAVREFFPPELFNRIDRIVPFRPLDATVAIEVAQKELSKLLARRGLVDRNVFASSSRSVVERVAREAFEQRDGARSLKRFLEDRIAGRLAEEISASPGASMQLVRIEDAGDGEPFVITREPLVEATPLTEASFALEPLLELPLPELLNELARAIAPLGEDGTLTPTLSRISEEIRFHLGEHNRGLRDHGELLYNLDHMRHSLDAFRDRASRVLTTSREVREEGYEDLELARFAWDTVDIGTGPSHTRWRYRVLSRSAFTRGVAAATRHEALACIAEAHFLKRSLFRAHDPSRHAVVLELARLGEVRGQSRLVTSEGGDKGRGGFLSLLARAYAARRGELDDFATVRDGVAIGGAGGPLEVSDSNVFALKLVGLCVRDVFELEEGTHVVEPLSGPPELVRVRIVDGAPPLEVVSTLLAARQERERARAIASERPSPDALTPMVRRVRLGASSRAGKPAPFGVEDFRMSFVDTVYARSVAEALEPLWLLQLSRVDDEKDAERRKTETTEKTEQTETKGGDS